MFFCAFQIEILHSKANPSVQKCASVASITIGVRCSIEPTCAHANAQWALMRRLLSVCLSVRLSVCANILEKKSLEKKSLGSRSKVTRGQGQRAGSKFKQERLQSYIKLAMKVSTQLSMHLCLAQRLVELVSIAINHFIVIQHRKDYRLYFCALYKRINCS